MLSWLMELWNQIYTHSWRVLTAPLFWKSCHTLANVAKLCCPFGIFMNEIVSLCDVT